MLDFSDFQSRYGKVCSDDEHIVFRFLGCKKNNKKTLILAVCLLSVVRWNLTMLNYVKICSTVVENRESGKWKRNFENRESGK